ncbi:MAG: hypothetical protein GY913_34285 [Proteobacteria bacterium]|nr:hypothetical protein [Pseudomonadota bacterium]MCP4921998.1 hypothetical protein [Pseudomonadota bacterium]
MKGILERLDRPLPGERQIGLTELAADLSGRLDRKVIEAKEKKVRAARSGKTRKPQVHCSTDSNAPQLIRLVRTPFQLHTGFPTRKRVIEKRQPIQAPERLSELIGLADRPRINFKSPAQDRIIPSAPPTRLWRGDSE